MVFKKPYAFLIKHFKLIHIILSILMAFLLYKFYTLYSFYNNYLKESKFSALDGISNTLITSITYILVFFIVGITFIIYLLMNFKKKNTKYYFISIIYYVLLIFALIFSKNELKQIEFDVINIRTIKLTRDILLVSIIFQIPFFIVSAVRAIGFNIKKFNFSKDIKELQISELDNEEIEIGINLDNNDIRTIVNRRKRLFKYFFKENKYIVLLFMSIIMIVTGALIFINNEVNNKVYKMNEELNTKSIGLKVLNSYNLTTNTSNNDISDNSYSFIVIKVLITNKLKTDIIVPISNFKLKTGDYTSYKADTDNYNSFLEFGSGYNNNTIKSLESMEYMLVFKIKKEDANNKKYLEYLTGVKDINSELKYNYAKFDLINTDLSRDLKVTNKNLNETIDFSLSLLKNSSINISNVEFNNSFTTSVKKCISSECYDTSTYIVPNIGSKYEKIIMKVDYQLNLDSSINSKLSSEFISKFGNLRYVIKDKEYNHGINLIDITPTGITNTSYLEVKKEVKDASKIYLDFRIRNKIYTYIIKG